MANPTQSLPSWCSECLLGSSVVHTTETGCMREKTTPASGCQPVGLKAPSLFVKRYFICFLFILCLFQILPTAPFESMLNEGWNCLLFIHPVPWTVLVIYNKSWINNCWLAGWMTDGWMNGWMGGFQHTVSEHFLLGSSNERVPLELPAWSLLLPTSMALGKDSSSIHIATLTFSSSQALQAHVLILTGTLPITPWRN